MCETKPGPRCSSHAKESLVKAKLKLQKAQEEGTQEQQSQAKENLAHSLRIWYSTPSGQEELQSKIDDPQLAEHKDRNEKLLANARALREKQKQALKKQQIKTKEGFDSDGIHQETGTAYDRRGLDKNGNAPYITNREREVFEDGDCWQLAKEINARTGYDYAMFYVELENEDEESQRREGWFHMANISPEGKIVDIAGVADKHTAMNEWEDSMGEFGSVNMCVLKNNEVDPYIHDDLNTFNPSTSMIKNSSDKVIALIDYEKCSSSD